MKKIYLILIIFTGLININLLYVHQSKSTTLVNDLCDFKIFVIDLENRKNLLKHAVDSITCELITDSLQIEITEERLTTIEYDYNQAILQHDSYVVRNSNLSSLKMTTNIIFFMMGISLLLWILYYLKENHERTNNRSHPSERQ